MDARALAVIGMAALVAYLATSKTVDENGESDNAPGITDYAAQAQDYIESYTVQGDDMNKTAFLNAIRPGEGTADAAGYNRLCGGGEFSSFNDHPANMGWPGWRLPEQMAINAGFASGVAFSTAAGAYQITRPTWNRVRARLGLTDFSPASQDSAAWYLIGEKGAQADVLAGRVAQAVARLGALWASLPGAAAKQRQVSITEFVSNFQSNGGNLA
jgi:muramidase (phage lysozyme)